MSDKSKLTESAIKLLSERYVSHDETVSDIFPRVAGEIARHTPRVNGQVKEMEKKYLKAMQDLDFLPNSPCIRNAGFGNMNKACATKDTIIHTLKGDFSIEQLMQMEDTYYVYCCDGEKLRISKALKPIYTKRAGVYRISFDNGESIKLTDDHLIMIRNGEFRMVKNLKPGTSLMPFNYKYKLGYRYVCKNIIDRYMPGYRFVYHETHGEWVDGTEHIIHHLDIDKSNDSPENLIKYEGIRAYRLSWL